MSRLTLIAAASLIMALVLHAPPGKGVTRFALLAGADDGGPTRPRLRYAVSDARAVAGVLSGLGGTGEDRQVVLVGPTPGDLERELSLLGARVAAARQAGERVEFLFYFSGHSDPHGLLLGAARYEYRDLKQALTRLGADVHIAILDSCASGALLAAKGGGRRPPFVVSDGSDVTGHAYLTSSSIDELAQESSRIQGSFFTHHLLIGLRGGADTDRDRRVTLHEAYRYAFEHTLARTERTLYGPQHPAYEIALAGRGDVVLTDLRSPSAVLALGPAVAGRLSIRTAEQRLVAEVDKRPGEPLSLAVEPGRYVVLWLRGERLFTARVTVEPGKEEAIDMDRFADDGTALVTRARGDFPDPEEEEEQGRVVVPVAFSVVPFLSTAGAGVAYDVTHLSLNLFGGVAQSVRGVELGPFVNVVRGDLIGLQHTLGVNVVGGSMFGFQFAGIGNFGSFEAMGLQIAGAVNQVEGDAAALQIAGVVNYVDGDAEGAQVTLGGNVATGDAAGLQVGAANVVGGELAGAQIGGVNLALGPSAGLQVGGLNLAGSLAGSQIGYVNLAGDLAGAQLGGVNLGRRVRGLQVGLVNLAEEVEGESLGLLSLIGNGYHKFEVFASDVALLNVAVKLGGHYLYTILSFGYSPLGARSWWFPGVGMGVHVPLPHRLSLDADLSAHFLALGAAGPRPDERMLFGSRLQVGLDIFDHFGLFLGVTVHAMAGELAEISPLMLPVEGEPDLAVWPGLFGGVRF
jgi:hypothetical protein